MPPTSRIVATLRRLGAASGDELVFRARRHLATARQRARFERRAAQRSAAAAPAAEHWQELARRVRARPDSRFPLSEPALRAVAAAHPQLFPGRTAQISARAATVLAHRFSFLGIEFDAGPSIAWQRCPSTGYEWPRRFHADVVYEGESLPDVKHTWELSRQQYLITCGQAYCLTGDPRVAAGAFRIIDSWIADNPYLQGINWTSALEVAMRALSWLWTDRLCGTWDGRDGAADARLVRSLDEHGEYLAQNLSFYVSPFNHLVGEATALYLLGCFLPERDAWIRTGWDILVAQVEQQFHPDGGSVEQATSYHHFSLGFFLLAVIVRRDRGEAVPAAMWSRLERALEFSMWMTRPDGHVPAIGDADDARSITFEWRAPFDFRNLLGLGAVLFGRSDMKTVAGELSEDVLWLLGPEGCEEFRRLPAVPAAATSRLFPASGYAVMRGGWGHGDHFTCFDCGPIAAGVASGGVSSAAHGHSDLLSVEIAPFGVPVVVDPGCWTYNGDLDWHRHAREIAAHNTVRVEQRSHARFTRRMSWSHGALPEPARWSTAGGFEVAECAHRGFEGLGGRVRHRRAIARRHDDRVFIIDRLEGHGVVDADAFFHLAPACRIAHRDASSAQIAAETGRVQVRVQCLGPAPLTLEVIEGGAGPDGGWVAASYGRRERAAVLRFHGRLELPASFGFAFSASRGEPEELQPVTLDASGDSVGCRVRERSDESIRFTWRPAGLEIVTGSSTPTTPIRRRAAPPSPADPVKILEIGPFPPPSSGWSVRIAHLQTALRDAGHDCITLNIGESRAVPSPDYECVRGGLDYLRKLRRYAARGYLFHLHVNGTARTGWLLAYAALAVARAARRAPVLTFHAGVDQRYFPRRNSPLAAPLLGYLFRRCAAVICNHDGVRRHLVAYGVPPERVHVIPAISRQYLAERTTSIPPAVGGFAAARSPLILASFDWAPWCAPESVLAALRQVVDAHGGAGVIIVARSADAEPVRRGLEAAGLADRSCCLAPLEHDAFLALLERVDVYVRSSRTEGVSSSVAEALALGTPVVANHGCHPDGVVSYRWGDAAALAAALQTVLRDVPAARRSIPPVRLADTLADETALLTRCARAAGTPLATQPTAVVDPTVGRDEAEPPARERA